MNDNEGRLEQAARALAEVAGFTWPTDTDADLDADTDDSNQLAQRPWWRKQAQAALDAADKVDPYRLPGNLLIMADSRVAQLMVVLAALEWIELPQGRGGDTICGSCHRLRQHGHRPGCNIAAALGRT